MRRPRHPYKEVEAAVQFAESHDWSFTKRQGHVWARLYCPHHNTDCCRISVWSTPRNGDDHARDIRREVLRCDHV